MIKEGEYMSNTNVNIFIPDYVLGVMDRIHRAGESAYIVGGCVRDALLGTPPNDYDMTVSCPPERTLEIFSDMRTIATGLKHGTVTVLSDGHPLELTTFRVDGSYTDSRRPDSVSFTRRIEDDLARRDFTVNAMAFAPNTGLIDLFGGQNDLKQGIIRAVGDPSRRFEEDALRIMRAFRFSAQLGFCIEDNTLRAAGECRNGLSNIARERIGVEFIKLLCSKDPAPAIKKMSETLTLDFASKRYMPSEKLLSLISKMPSQDVSRLGFYLCEADPDTARDIINQLKYSNRLKNGALAIVRESHTAISSPRDATLLRSRVGEYAPLVAKASSLLGYSLPSAVELTQNDSTPSRIDQLAIGGNDLLELGVTGRQIGATLAHLLDEVITDPQLNTRQALIELVKKREKEKE